ncbi:ankyrin repeat domain-containing protein [bacterium]|nr:MAG: ankyrin repeat domain-containing protein [bacterium]
MNKFFCLLFVVLSCANIAAPAAFPLHVAAKIGDVKEIERLLTEKICSVNDRNDYGGTALHYAAGNCQAECVKALLKCGAAVNDRSLTLGSTPLHWAASNGCAECMIELLAGGATVDLPDKNGLTQLHYAAKLGHKNCVDLLLAKGANANAKTTKSGNTPAMFAEQGGHHELARYLKGIAKCLENKEPAGEQKQE